MNAELSTWSYIMSGSQPAKQGGGRPGLSEQGPQLQERHRDMKCLVPSGELQPAQPDQKIDWREEGTEGRWEGDKSLRSTTR